MKKHILLFVILLAMFVDAFGQNTSTVLWETMVESQPIGTQWSYYELNPVISTSHNILVQYNYNLNNVTYGGGIKAYDTNGKILWNAANYFKKSATSYFADVRNKNYTLLSSNAPSANGFYRDDSTFYLNKDYKFLKGFDNFIEGSYVLPMDDGIFFNKTDKTIIKYDIDGKQEWSYQDENKNGLVVLNQKAPYLCLVGVAEDAKPILILNKNGEKIGVSEPQTFRQQYPANDKGFWLLNKENEYIKFDSTGKKTAKFSVNSNSQWNWDNPVMSTNSLLVNMITDTRLLLNLISDTGKINEVSIPFPFKVNFNTYFKYKEIAPNVIMYALAMPEREVEADIIYKIGVVNFNDDSKSWSKDIHGGASNGINGNAITFEAGNTFFQAYSSPIQPNIKSFKTYDIDGNVKWESTFLANSFQGFPFQWKIIDEYVYFNGFIKDPNRNSYTNVGSLKIKFTDGKIIWNRKETLTNISTKNGVEKNKYGEDVVLLGYTSPNVLSANNTPTTLYNITTLNADGTNKWYVTIAIVNGYPLVNYVDKIYFKPIEDDQLIVYSLSENNGQLQYFLRKIALCNNLETVTLTGNTQACPTEKVRLSVSKLEHVNYQWQKDGIDLPNFKDTVYDIAESGIYTVRLVDEYCQIKKISNPLTVMIHPLPSTQITAPKTLFCEGEKTTIVSQTNGTFFQWQKDEKDIPNATSGIYEVSQSGHYRVGVRGDKCPQVGYSNIVTIAIKPMPEAIIKVETKGASSSDFTVKMTTTIGTGFNYQWLKNDSLIANATTSVYEAKKSGTYAVRINQEGCIKTSEPLVLNIQIPLGILDEVGEVAVKIYPNPNRGIFNVLLPQTLKGAAIQLFDHYGRERVITHTNEQIQAEGLMQGIYFLKITKGGKVVTNKIMIE